MSRQKEEKLDSSFVKRVTKSMGFEACVENPLIRCVTLSKVLYFCILQFSPLLKGDTIKNDLMVPVSAKGVFTCNFFSVSSQCPILVQVLVYCGFLRLSIFSAKHLTLAN